MRIMVNRNTSGARDLARAMGLIRVRPDRNFRNNRDHTILNWGCTTVPQFPVNRWINPPEAVANAVDKIKCLEILTENGIPTVTWTTDGEEAEALLEDGFTLVARSLISSHSGRGISLVEPGNGLPDAKLYSVYIPKRVEFRVHVVHGQVVDLQRKRARRGAKETGELNYNIRNHSGGWVYTREGVELPGSVLGASLRAVGALGLNFGAVDVVRDTREGWKNLDDLDSHSILEVNTAPGLYGTTLERYAEALNVCY